MNKTKNPAEIAQAIYEILSKEKINSVTHCMTRFRLDIADCDEEIIAKLKNVNGVLGVNYANGELQIVIGPSIVDKVTNEFNRCLSSGEGKKGAKEKSPFDGKELHEKIRAKNQTPIKIFFKKISTVFLPIIPAFIACGLLTGINNVLLELFPALGDNAFFKLSQIIGNTAFYGIHMLTGWNAAKVFDGTPAIGACLAMLLNHPALSSISLFDSALTPGRGGIIAVLLVVIFSSFIEKKIRLIVPSVLDLFLTPLCTIIISGFIAILILQPIGGFLSECISKSATFLVNSGGALAGFFLAGLWLPCVMLGIHQMMTPIHAELIARDGVTILLPILAMAGAGQVGASIAVYVRTKNETLKHTILSALPVGILGVGEPLIYGVTLPLMRPFIGACIGAGFGGAFIASFSVGANAFGISGLPLAAATTMPLIYIVGLLISYLVGFIAAYLMKFSDPV